MTAEEKEAVEALNARIDQTAALAFIASQADGSSPITSYAMRGIHERLTEIAARLDAIVTLKEV